MSIPEPVAEAGHISTRISFLDMDGATKTFGIELPFGASDQDIQTALDQAERQKIAMMLRWHYQGDQFNPSEMLFGFGKHRMKTVGWIVRNDRRYVDEYLLTLPDLDPVWRSALNQAIAALSEANGASFVGGDMPL